MPKLKFDSNQFSDADDMRLAQLLYDEWLKEFKDTMLKHIEALGEEIKTERDSNNFDYLSGCRRGVEHAVAWIFKH